MELHGREIWCRISLTMHLQSHAIFVFFLFSFSSELSDCRNLNDDASFPCCQVFLDYTLNDLGPSLALDLTAEQHLMSGSGCLCCGLSLLVRSRSR